MLRKYEPLGTFDVPSGKLRITDPEYSIELGERCAGTVNAVAGKWEAFVSHHTTTAFYTNREGEKVPYQDRRVDILFARAIAGKDVVPFSKVDNIYISVEESEDEKETTKSLLNWSEDWTSEKFVVGVDCAKAGIFDYQNYQNHSVIPDEDTSGLTAKDWINYVEGATECDADAGVVPFGVISKSGYGDGAYDTFTMRDDNGDAIAVVVVF